MSLLTGLSAFPITPADQNGRVDTTALRAIIARLSKANVDSIGLLGSTGIYMYLTREERSRALEATLSETQGHTPVMISVSALRTDDAVRFAQDAKAIGAAAGLLAPVSYTPITQEEAFEHFSTVARQSCLPLVIYDNPGTTHFHFTPELILRLSEISGIVGIKNAAGEADATARLLQQQRVSLPRNFSIGCSGDWGAAEALIAGADTWHSVLGGLFPRICMEIVRAVQTGDVAKARHLDASLAPIWALFKQYSSLRVAYTIAELLGLSYTQPPRPILPLPDTVKAEIAKACKELASADPSLATPDHNAI